MKGHFVNLTDDDLELVPTSGSQKFTGFGIEVDGDRVGTVALRHESKGLASIRWNGAATTHHHLARALKIALEYGFTELHLSRIETRTDPDDLGGLRSASMAGMRREGLIRGSGGTSPKVLLARLADDAPPYSRDGFTAILNAGLPKKRVISQGLLRNQSGEFLLCQLTYKAEWDLPGGVIEPGEPPAAGLIRELEEELGVTFEINGLVTVNWLPSWSGWEDACVFVFDLGTASEDIVENLKLQPTEIRSVQWCDASAVDAHATAVTKELLGALQSGDIPAYREAPRAD